MLQAQLLDHALRAVCGRDRARRSQAGGRAEGAALRASQPKLRKWMEGAARALTGPAAGARCLAAAGAPAAVPAPRGPPPRRTRDGPQQLLVQVGQLGVGPGEVGEVLLAAGVSKQGGRRREGLGRLGQAGAGAAHQRPARSGNPRPCLWRARCSGRQQRVEPAAGTSSRCCSAGGQRGGRTQRWLTADSVVRGCRWWDATNLAGSGRASGGAGVAVH